MAHPAESNNHIFSDENMSKNDAFTFVEVDTRKKLGTFRVTTHGN